MTHRLLNAFHPSGASFAIVSHDQRLKVFSTLTQQLQQDLTEAQHLTHSITAIAYPLAATKSPAAHIIALGTKAGEILLWNTKKGELEHKIGVTTAQTEKHQGAITSLAFHASGSYLFSASADKSLKQWSVGSGAFVASFQGGSESESAAYSKLAASADGNLLVAGGAGALVLWNIATPATPVREYQGPTERISCVAFSPDSKYVVSGNSTDRYLSLWSAETEAEEEAPQKKKSKKSASKAARNTPVHTITLQTAPISVQFNSFLTSPKAYQIGALSDSSIVSLLQWAPSAPAGAAAAAGASTAAASASTPQSTISIPASLTQTEAAKRRDAAYQAAGKNNKHKSTAASSTLLAGEQGDSIGAGGIQGFQFESGSKLLVARGDAVRPQFESVEFKKGDAFDTTIVLGKFQTQHLMNNANNAAAAATGAQKRKASASSLTNEAVTLGSQHMTDVVQSASSGLDGESAKKKAKLSSKSDALSRSLADRLAESEAASSGVSSFNLATGELPKAGSLQTILQQALHSHDTALVEYCLTAGAQQMASNSNLVRATVKRLSPVYVLPLLNHLMAKFASRPNRSAALLPWLREIFKNHTAYLIRQPQLTHKLSPLYHLLDTRLSVFKKLLKLQGRLELLLSQISSAKNPGAEDEEDAAAQGPLNTFNDGDAVDEQAMSGADEEGEEDDEDQEDEEDEDMEDGEDDDEEAGDDQDDEEDDEDEE